MEVLEYVAKEYGVERLTFKFLPENLVIEVPHDHPFNPLLSRLRHDRIDFDPDHAATLGNEHLAHMTRGTSGF
jgi:hypothetical protein